MTSKREADIYFPIVSLSLSFSSWNYYYYRYEESSEVSQYNNGYRQLFVSIPL